MDEATADEVIGPSNNTLADSGVDGVTELSELSPGTELVEPDCRVRLMSFLNTAMAFLGERGWGGPRARLDTYKFPRIKDKEITKARKQ